MAPKVVPAEIRFWRFVDKNGPVSERMGSRCWLWTGAKSTCPNGLQYGRFRGEGSRMVPSHRFSWIMKNGQTDAAAIDHLCRVTLCVNPDHLEPVSDRENILRGAGLAAENAKKTHCLRGHLFDARSRNGRYCRVCKGRRDSCKRGHPFDRISVSGRRFCSICASELGKANMASRWGGERIVSRLKAQMEQVAVRPR